MLAALPDRLIGARDQAMLLVGFLGGFRRSELAALDVADLDFTREGLVITVRRSKTDQEGEGLKKALPFRPDPAACQNWPSLRRRSRNWAKRAGERSGSFVWAME